jgi:hypothetical protein
MTSSNLPALLKILGNHNIISLKNVLDIFRILLNNYYEALIINKVPGR